MFFILIPVLFFGLLLIVICRDDFLLDVCPFQHLVGHLIVVVALILDDLQLPTFEHRCIFAIVNFWALVLAKLDVFVL